ncbi:MAG: radical SAM protein [Deltaproteobacteria bacterium]|nr:MAG: radical SAM protein [Deltaproteobacteria bacterium]
MAVGRLRLKQRGYDFPPYRPPSEAYSLLLRVTRGCPWNKCLFCSMYKGIPFERRSLEEIKGDIEAAAHLYGEMARWAFIGDSNSLVVKTDLLLEILRYLYESFPHLERVTSYARAKTIAKKDLNELKELRRAGLVRLHVGLETGDAKTLNFIKKGATPEEMIEGGLKAKEAGFELSLYILLGIGGQQRWREHADGTGEVLNKIDPHFIRVRTLIPQPGSALFEMKNKGEFILPPPDLILEEERRIIASLEVTSQFLSDHISNYLPLNGKMPQDKNALLHSLDQELLRLRQDPSLLERYRRKELLRHL